MNYFCVGKYPSKSVWACLCVFVYVFMRSFVIPGQVAKPAKHGDIAYFTTRS